MTSSSFRRRSIQYSLALLAGLASAASAQEPGVIVGVVHEAGGVAPVANAQVALEAVKRATRTDAQGEFTFSNVPAGEYTLKVTRFGFAESATRVSVRGGQTIRVELVLTASAISLDQLVVSASKTLTEIRDVPAPVHVVASAVIDQTGSKSVMEVLRNVPGVTDASFGENFQSVQLRGLPPLANENETVLILLDGVPQTDARNSAQVVTIPVDIIDHVEVVKGPNSALYGRTAIGGVVSIFTKDPRTEQDFRVRMQTGDFGLVRLEASAGGPIGSTGETGYFVSWLGDRHVSFQKPGVVRRESSIFGKFITQLDSKTELVMTANYLPSQGGTPGPVPIVDGQLLSDAAPGYDRFTNLNLPYAEWNQETARATVSITRDLSPTLRLSNTAAYRHNRYDARYDGDFLLPPAPATQDVVLFPFNGFRAENAYFDDLHLEARFGPERMRHRLLVGGSFEQNTGHRNTVLFFDDSDTGGVIVDYENPVFPSAFDLHALDLGGIEYTTTFWGIYAQDEIDVGDRLKLSIGARTDINVLEAQPQAPATGWAGEQTYTKTSPKFGASYRVLDNAAADMNVYASYSKAFLPPIAAPAGQTITTAAPEAEDIVNYEFGIKGSAFSGRIGYDASAFYLERDGIPILVRTGGFEFQRTNGGVQKFPGLELGLSANITSELWTYVQYAYYGAEFGEFRYAQGDRDVDLTGNRLSLSPRHVANAGLDYRHSGGFGVNVIGQYRSSRYLDNSEKFLLDPYFIADTRLSWDLDEYTVAVSASNLFNTEYVSHGETSAADFAFAGARRRMVLELTANF